MVWEIVPVSLSLIGVAVVAAMLVIALVATIDPPAFTHCHDCQRWMVDTRHRPDALCFRCRHSHHAHVGVVPFHTARR
jgi:hypothetical protein